MARLIRIAVNLLLIVSVTMQSTVLCALQKACSAACTSQFTCLECGCCQVEEPVDRCGCCGGHAEDNSEGDGASCCGDDGTDQYLAATPSAEASVAPMGIAAGPVLGNLSTCCAEASSDSSAVDSACHCLQAPETPYAPVPRSHANEDCDPVALSFALTELVKSKDQLVSVSDNANAPLSTLPRFSQIQLCVWRL